MCVYVCIVYVLRVYGPRTFAKQTTMQCTNKHGGFGYPHFAEPFGFAIQSTVKSLLADSEIAKNLLFNNVTDPCPELPKKQPQTMGPKLPFVTLPWPSRHPAPGYVPKTSPLNERKITDSGGDNQFINESLKRGRLDSAVASKIRLDVHAKEACEMFLKNHAA